MTALTRILSAASSFARYFTRISIAPFIAPRKPWKGIGVIESIPETATIFAFRSAISGAASCTRWRKLFTVTLKVLSIWWSFIAISGTNAVEAAFATSASRCPNSAFTCSNTGFSDSGSSWSATSTRHLRPSASTSRCRLFAASSSRR